MRSARSPWLFVGVFLGGVALGWGALPRGREPDITPLDETSERDARTAEVPRTEGSRDGAAPPIDPSGDSVRPAPTLAPVPGGGSGNVDGLAARMS